MKKCKWIILVVMLVFVGDIVATSALADDEKIPQRIPIKVLKLDKTKLFQPKPDALEKWNDFITNACSPGYYYAYPEVFDLCSKYANKAIKVNGKQITIGGTYACVYGVLVPPNACPLGSKVDTGWYSNVVETSPSGGGGQYVCMKDKPFKPNELKCGEGFELMTNISSYINGKDVPQAEAAVGNTPNSCFEGAGFQWYEDHGIDTSDCIKEYDDQFCCKKLGWQFNCQTMVDFSPPKQENACKTPAVEAGSLSPYSSCCGFVK